MDFQLELFERFSGIADLSLNKPRLTLNLAVQFSEVTNPLPRFIPPVRLLYRRLLELLCLGDQGVNFGRHLGHEDTIFAQNPHERDDAAQDGANDNPDYLHTPEV